MLQPNSLENNQINSKPLPTVNQDSPNKRIGCDDPEVEASQSNNTDLNPGIKNNIQSSPENNPTELTLTNSPSDKGDESKATNIFAAVTIAVTLFCGMGTIWRDVQKSIDERFLKTIELIGHTDRNVRSGAIIALKQVFQDSPNRKQESVELLANLVRINSPVSSKDKNIPADVLMSLKVIKQTEREGKEETLNLSHVNLFGTDLSKGKLKNVSFNHSNLQSADLKGADLKGSYFTDANLAYATVEPVSSNEELKELAAQIKKACNWHLAIYDEKLKAVLKISKKMNNEQLEKRDECKKFGSSPK